MFDNMKNIDLYKELVVAVSKETGVEKIKYTNAAGEKKTGAHWNVDQIQEATKGMPFPNGTTPWTNTLRSTRSTLTCVRYWMRLLS